LKIFTHKICWYKRFGLDGAESLIPSLEQIIKIGGQSKVKEIKIGMSHRGRLNVLANVLQKSYKRILMNLQVILALPQKMVLAM